MFNIQYTTRCNSLSIVPNPKIYLMKVSHLSVDFMGIDCCVTFQHITTLRKLIDAIGFRIGAWQLTLGLWATQWAYFPVSNHVLQIQIECVVA